MEISNFSTIDWVIILASAMIIGFGKAGVPGVATLVPVSMAMVFPAARSVGILLPMLIFGDIFALTYHRRHAHWQHLRKALPWGIGGILLGFVLLLIIGRMNVDIDFFLKKAIGIIVLSVLGLSIWLSRGRTVSGEEPQIQSWLAPFLGLLGGVSTMLANAAGPIFACYLLALGLPKRKYMGSAAWLFFILNNLKVPFHIYLGNITVDTFIFNLALVPAIGLGALVGIIAFKLVPDKGFKVVVYILTIIAAAKLLLPESRPADPQQTPPPPPPANVEQTKQPVLQNE